MPQVIPTLRVNKAIKVSSMDCIQRGGPADDDQDCQHYNAITKARPPFTQAPTDSKELWTFPLIPFRTIHAAGELADYGNGDIFSLVDFIVNSDAVWNGNDAQGPLGAMPPAWGSSYVWFPKILPGINLLPPGSVGFVGNEAYLWSNWMYVLAGTAIPNTPVDPRAEVILAVITQIICPDAFNPQKYELWSVTTRNAVFPTNEEGDPLNVPTPYPWSMSSDWTKIKTGTLNPGQTLVIPPPMGFGPQVPPAPSGGFASPNTYGGWHGWGAATFIAFL